MTNQSTLLQEFEALEHQWADIFIRTDAAALDELLMDDFIYTSARGEVLHKPQYLQNLASGEVQMQGEEYSQLAVRQHEDVAVVTGVVMLQASYQGQDISGANLFTKVWLRHQGRWQALALHACLPPQLTVARQQP